MKTTKTLILALVLALATGCDDEAMDAVTAEVALLRTAVDEAEDERLAMQGQLDAVEPRLAALEEAAGIEPAWGASIDQRLLALEGAGYMTQAAFDETAAADLTEGDLDDLAEAWSWGDHGVVGYLTGYIETDPVAMAEGFLTVESDPVAMAEVPDIEASIADLEDGKVGRISSAVSPLALVVSMTPAADEFATINDALAWLDGYSIDSDATVQIQVQVGTYSGLPPIDVHHPDGDRIEILGFGPSQVDLEFTGHGFQVQNGSRLGLLNGVHIGGPGMSSTARAIDVSNGSFAEIGADVTIDGFEVGIWASGNSVVYANGVHINNAWIGMKAVSGSYLNADASSLSNSTNDGFHCGGNAFVSARDTVLTGIADAGYYPWWGCVLVAEGGNGSHEPSGMAGDPAWLYQ